jgi:hypothetical protein
MDWQNPKQCHDNFYNSPVGKVVKFGSVLSLVPGLSNDPLSQWVDWAVLGGGKVLLLKQFSTGMLTGTELASLSTGAILRYGGFPLLEKMVGGALGLGPWGLAAATGVDAIVWGICAVNPQSTGPSEVFEQE